MAETLQEKIKKVMLGSPAVLAILGTSPMRLWRLQAPQGTPEPYGLVSFPTGKGENDLKGDAGLDNIRVRFDIYGLSYPVLESLKEAIRDSMDQALELGATFVWESEDYESDTGLFHMTFDFSVWHSRPHIRSRANITEGDDTLTADGSVT